VTDTEAPPSFSSKYLAGGAFLCGMLSADTINAYFSLLAALRREKNRPVGLIGHKLARLDALYFISLRD
jgi:hypothetical protein